MAAPRAGVGSIAAVTDPMEPPTGPADEVEVDVRAFLPEGVSLGEAEPAEAEVAVEVEAAPPSSEEAIDLTSLEAAEAAMAEVEDALIAIDAGDLDRSPLLSRLLTEG